MSDLKPNAQEDKDVEPVCDSPGPTQEPLQSHTFSPDNNAEGLSSDEHENPLNGAQPNPFVYSSVPAVPHAGNSLPSGPLVNGPGSHPTSEVRCVLNKGGILSNNVLDTTWQPEKDGGPQVLPPPSELQSDAWQNTAGPVLKTLPTQPGANAALSDSEENESELACSTPSGDSSDRRHISRTLISKAIKTSSLWDLNTELSESSSDDYDDNGGEVIRWYSQKELIRSLWNGITVNRRSEKKSTAMPHLMSQKEKHNTHAAGTLGSPEKLYSDLNQTYKHFHTDDDDVDDFDVTNKHASLGKKSDSKYSVELRKDHSRNPSLDTDQLVRSEAEKGCDEENDPEGEEDSFSTKPEQLKTERSEQDQLFFPCTICNVHFKEKRHLHRHMMYHLDRHNQVHNENVPQPFICRECGRSFCDSSSLMKHIIIHQKRLEKLMEEIKGLKKLENEGKDAKLQCPHCAFESNCRKTFVQHAKTHENIKRYYCCEECNYFALTHHALEAHLHTAHLNTHQPKYLRLTPTHGTEVLDPAQFQCKLCFFTSQDKQVLKRHSELEHREWFQGKCETPVTNEMSACADSTVNQLKFTEQSKIADSKPVPLKPNVCNKQPAFLRSADLTCWSSRKADIYIKKSDKPNSYKSLNSSQFKSSVGCTTNMLSPYLWKTDKQGTFSVQPVEKIDVTTGLPYVEENNHKYDHRVSSDAEQTNYPSNTNISLTDKTVKVDQMFCEGNKDVLASFCSQEQGCHKSPSKRKMSTPLHNTINMINNDALSKCNQRLKDQGTCTPEHSEQEYEDSYDFSDYTSEATANFLDSSENEKNPYARSYFIRRQRFSVKEDTAAIDCPIKEEDNEDDDDDCSDIQQLIIKEEYIESAVCEDSPESPAMAKNDPSDILPTSEAEHKACPYCPAVFESGVGLSNHVRGHLHRVGLSYNARHMVSPEQVALQDCQPRIRRKIPSSMRRLKKADKPESQGEHTCPLCWGWFDTKTGLSNHVRGHLKRIGKTVTSDNKSPVCVLNELLQDKEEHQNILQILNRKQFPSRPFVSQKFIGSNGLFLVPTGIPVEIQYGMRDITPWSSFVPKQEAEVFSERKEPQIEMQGANEPCPSTLVELLKTRERDVETKERDVSYATSKHFNMTKERRDEAQATGECDSNKRICIHCNTIFPSAVSLSNHLRAYARRKRIAILEGTSYDFKQKKPRSRPGLKKKVFPSLNTVEEIYRLTCRFCDLVFQGPLSVQEDWIKHLQRHLMHTSVPRSGTGMVEVLGLHQEKHPMPPQHPSLEQHISPLELPVAS